MSDGGAQFYSIGPLWDAGNLKVYSQPKLHHYAAGTSNDKDIWANEDKTGALAQPFIAGTDGKFNFYADGDYKFVVTTSADAAIDTYDNVRITSDTATMWEGNWGVTVPAATVNNQGQMFAEHEATTFDFEALHINHGGGAGGAGPAFLKILDFVGGIEKKADLILGAPVTDVRYYGAVGDGVTDDSAAVQNAATAIPATGGTLYFPKGTYLMTADIDIVNKPCHVTGDGVGQSIIKWSTGSDYGIDFDSTNIKDALIVDNLTLHTDIVGGGDAINANWPTLPLTRSNCIIRDIEIAPTVAAFTTAYFTRGVVLSDSSNAQIDNVTTIGKSDDIAGMTNGILVQDSSNRLQISNCNIWYSQYGIHHNGASSGCIISNNYMEYVDEGITFTFASLYSNHIVIANTIKSLSKGISCIYVDDSNLSNNILIKHSPSVSDYTGISIASTSATITVVSNSIREAGTSGTDIGIDIDGDNCSISNNFIEDQDTGISSTGNNNDINGNKIKTVTTGISTTGDTGEISYNTVSATTKCITTTGDSNSIIGNLLLDATTGIQTAPGSNTNYVTSNRSDSVSTLFVDTGTENRFPNNYLPDASIVISSASTITLPAYGDMFVISGSTTISTISASWEGRQVTLYSVGGTAQVLDGSNLALAGNFTFASLSTLTLRASWSGDWYEVSRSVN